MSTGATQRDHGHGRLGNILSGLAVAFGVVLFLGGFVWGAIAYQPYTVPTDSMQPTVNPGDRVLAQRVDGGEVHRGDVVVFTDPEWGDVPMVKRVVGVGGDKISCCDAQGHLMVDGRPISEPYLKEHGRASGNSFSATVPAGRLFLMGDNRNVSEDSRIHLTDADHGTVPRDVVTARVQGTVWPLGRLGGLTRPSSFAALPGGLSHPGPLTWIASAVGAGTVLILGGAAYGPIAGRRARRRTEQPVPAAA